MATVASISAQTCASVYNSSLTHTVPSGATLALAMVRQYGTGNQDAAPTLGGVAMEPVGAVSYGGSGSFANYLSLWSLVNPAPGSSVFLPNGTNVRGFAVECFEESDTATPILTSVTGFNNDSTTDPSQAVTSATDDLVVMACSVSQSGYTITGFAAAAGTTVDASLLQDNNGVGFFSKAGSGSVTLGVDATANSPGKFHSGWVAVRIKAASAAGVNLAGAGVLQLAGASTIAVQSSSHTPNADTLARVEVWSDYECAVGLEGRLVVLPEVVSCRRTRRLQDVASLDLVVPINTAAAFIRNERVLRTVYVGGAFEEWRIKGCNDAHTDEGGLIKTVRAMGPEQDLATRAVVSRTEVDGAAAFDFEHLGHTIREHMQDLILPALAANGSGYWGVGAVEPLSPVDIVYASSNPLELVRRLAQQTGSEWRVRRQGVSSYLIDFLWQAGSEWEPAQIRAGVNARGIQRDSSSAEQMTRGYPQGAAVEGRRATMARNRWQVLAVNLLDVQLVDPLGGDGPIAFDGQLSGATALALRLPSGVLTAITGSVSATQKVTVASTTGITPGMLVEICHANGDDLTYLDAPVEALQYGIIARPIERPDIPGTVNLVPNPAMRVWSGAATTPPDGWSPVVAPGLSTPTLMRTTTPGLYRFGGKSCRVQGTGDGTGLRTPLFVLSPTAARPYGIGYVSGWLASGRARAELVVARAPFTVSSLTRSGQVATVSTEDDHELEVGDRVELMGANQSEYVDVFTVQSVPSTTSFTVIVVGSPATPGTGTITGAKTWIIPDGTNGKALIQQVNAWADIWVSDQAMDLNALGAVSGYLRIIQDGATALDFYWDAAQLTQANVQEAFVEGSGPTQLWQETNRQLRLMSQLLVRFDVDVVNLAAIDAAIWSRYAFGPGQVTAILDAEVPVEARTRVLEIEDELVATRTLRVNLSSRAEDVTDLLVRQPRPDRLPRGVTTAVEFSLQIRFEDIATNPGAVGVRLSARPANGRIKYQVLDVGAPVPVIGAGSYQPYTGPFVVNQDQANDLVIAAYVEDGTRVSAIQTWDVDRDNVPVISLTSTEPSAGTVDFSWSPDDDVEKVRLYYRLDASNWPTLDGTTTGILDQTYFVGEINVREDGGSVGRDGLPLAGVLDQAGTSRTGIGGTTYRKTGLANGNVVRVIAVPVDRRGNLGARVSVTRTVVGSSSAALTAFQQSALTNSAGSAPSVGQQIYANLSWTPNGSVTDGGYDLILELSIDGGAWEELVGGTVATPSSTTTKRIATGYVYATGKYNPVRAFTFRARLVDTGAVLIQSRVSNQQSMQTRDAPI